ncbi:oxidoreductase, 2OG-Fe(II) oxygenase family [Reticulomyxa filosa]|uniref:Oxidoreductase, 2OG-Fe(II) oxygenase family n=1 Tax=Reticulomyxa filosa TaxID=46433 RepID=X6N516_RETFI|nr:oxidoreductase, 2OG-Fe(II) oxygenase family [Reticulomyxa filosa]|eukprot:ETO21136.1 oxidoreductase, 2OG-Fe(II) oxygenase family [Reticulomyxa filosa]
MNACYEVCTIFFFCVCQSRDNNHDVAWYVESPCTCDYEYDVNDPQPYQHMPLWLKLFRQHLLKTLHLPLESQLAPNSCFINWYKNGNAGIDAHADDEILFEAEEYPCLIISFTLGAERLFQLWNLNENEPVNKRNRHTTLLRGDLCLRNMEYVTMQGMFQKYFKHSIPRYDKAALNEEAIQKVTQKLRDENARLRAMDEKVLREKVREEVVQHVGPRINFTWRWVTHHLEGCPLHRTNANASSN